MTVAHPLTAYRNSFTPPKSQDDLARELSVSRNAINRWENGKRKVDIEILPRVAKHTGIPARDLRPDLAELFDPERLT
ncbi:helix-turn-helix transcriptional regulator [Mesorhizobium sp.]|uniref:helix-turn-helix transcriptional regulator n=1 Tax=Mesorhizobium sp. TaxID=1871066 RepID=UPI0025EA51E5|nr:helix-turn-helix transcriptional regulator [Mesorhizobium sp.]